MIHQIRRLRWFWLVSSLIAIMVSSLPVVAQDGPQTHIVQEGETLTAIAEQYRVSIDALLAANEITDPNMVFPGLELRIPDASELSASAGEPIATTALPVAPSGATYVVQPSDTINTIAQRLEVSESAIVANNFGPGDDPNLIFAGQVLVIPVEATRSALPVTQVVPDATYTVQIADILDNIALAYNKSLLAIAYANDLQAPYVLMPGQVLLIPGDAPPYGVVPAAPGEAAPLAISQPTADLMDGQGGFAGDTYIVQEGDTLLSIIVALDIDLDTFLRANSQLLNQIELEPGTELIIPSL